MNDEPGLPAPAPGRHSDSETRSRYLCIRLTAGELAEIETRSAALGLSTVDLLRRAVFRRRLPRPIPTLNREVWVHLGPLAADLDRYARAISENVAPALELIERLHQEIAAFREELAGRGGVEELGE
jgi:hypothetical protein